MLKIHKASAGSGKTYRLALEYIKMLLGRTTRDPSGETTLRLDPRPERKHRSILAMTFTNKATNEMKHRILHELALLAGCEPGWTASSPYSEELTRDLHCSPRQLCSSARRALTSLVMDYNFFNVSTIDAFFQSVLRTFAREARVMGDYNVSLEDEDVIALGVGHLLTSLNHAPANDPAASQMTAWVQEYMQTLMEEGHSFNLFNATGKVRSGMVKFIEKISDEHFALHHQELMQYLGREDNPISAFSKAIRRMRRFLEEQIPAIALDMLTELTPLMDGLDANCRKWLEKVGAGALDSKTFATKSPQRFASGTPFKNNVPVTPETLQFCHGRAGTLLEAYGLLGAVIATQRSLYVLGLIKGTYDAIDALHRDTNTIQLSDTNKLLREIIGDDDTPFIYERLGMQLSHYLIDEFQDTSHMQWLNLHPLVAESHGRDEDNLIIGDEKQCIYRFRNSDPSLLKEQVQKQFDRVSISGGPDDRSTNWRSSSTVVKFNNTLFTTMELSPGVRSIYSNVVQTVAPKRLTHGGFVSFLFLAAEKEKENDTSERDPALDRMLTEIGRQLQAGYAPSDICVLARRRQEAINAIEYLLDYSATLPEEERFSVISDDALMVKSSPVVRCLLTSLRFLGAADVKAGHHGVSPRRLAALFNYFETGLSEALMAARTRWDDPPAENGSPYAATDIDELAGHVLARALERLEAEEQAARQQQEPDAAEREASPQAGAPRQGMHADTVLATDLQAVVERLLMAIPEEMRRDEALYVTAFMDMVGEYMETGLNDINSFLRWWDQAGSDSRVSSPEGAGALRVMTIHKSKGLEFKCVHIPYGSWAMNDMHSTPKWYAPVSYSFGDMEIDPSIVPPLVPLATTAELDRGPYAPQATAYRDEQMLDELNVLYVALTRAVDELIVTCAPPPKKDAKTARTGPLIRRALELMTATAETDTLAGVTASEEPEGTLFSAGIPAAPGMLPRGPEKKEPPTALEPTQAVPMPAYYLLDRSDLWRDTRLDLELELELGEEVPLTPRTRGNALHAALECLRSPQEAGQAVMRVIMAGLLPRGSRREIVEVLQKALADPVVRPWFEGCRRVMKERRLFTGKDEQTGELLTRRPDRVVWTAAGTIDVIDYKTGALPADEPQRQAKIEAWKRQVRRYAAVLRRSLPTQGMPVRPFIWHLDEQLVIPC